MKKADFQNVIEQLAGPRGKSKRPPKLRVRLDRRCRRRQSEGVPLFPDEIEVLRWISRAIDKERNGGLAWQMVRDISLTGIDSRGSELELVHTAIAANIHDCTVAYVKLNSDPLTVATGMFIAIGTRVFLATTSHSLPAKPEGKLSFVGMPLTSLNESIPTVVDFGKDADETKRDVAYLEIDPAFVRRLDKHPLPLSRVYPCGTGQKKLFTIVSGYPSDRLRKIRAGKKRFDLQFNFHCWGNTILLPADWHILPKRRPAPDRRTQPDEHYDVFVPYPRNDDVISCGTSSVDALPEPFGMSGGGYWQPKRARKVRIWRPDSYCLIAIQSSWWGCGRYLQATQIIHWLKLVWNQRPDVRADLKEALPKVRWSAPGRQLA